MRGSPANTVSGTIAHIMKIVARDLRLRMVRSTSTTDPAVQLTRQPMGDYAKKVVAVWFLGLVVSICRTGEVFRTAVYILPNLP